MLLLALGHSGKSQDVLNGMSNGREEGTDPRKWSLGRGPCSVKKMAQT